jgi:hypothetical protein
MYMRDVMFMRRANYYYLIKDEKLFIINAREGNFNISLASAQKDKSLINQPRSIYFFSWDKTRKTLIP